MPTPPTSPPKAVLLDLDDTILDDSGNVESCWRAACHTCDIPGVAPDDLYNVLDRMRNWYWSDAERHRTGRFDLLAARTRIVDRALKELGVYAPGLVANIASTYAAARDKGLQALEGAIETVVWLRRQGCKLALVTNGAADAQRRKIERFRLGALFDDVLIEGELGFGKPDSRVYELALTLLKTLPSGTWMIGDNLECDVRQPQQLGIVGVWVDVVGGGVPATANVQPDYVIRRLADVKDVIVKSAVT